MMGIDLAHLQMWLGLLFGGGVFYVCLITFTTLFSIFWSSMSMRSYWASPEQKKEKENANAFEDLL